ncbi:MAG TPA: hypothetical protein VHT05_01520 [Candidatus Elarobacter sp.]|jgi:hypothetical protein|nr:hypothetical protein [Candidatus Elarobacter sp.]
MVFIALFLVCGIGMIVAGRQLAPTDSVAAQVFRTDPSCAANLSAVKSRGACTVVNAMVLSAEMQYHGFSRTRARTPVVALRFADGTFHDGVLVGSDGDFFVDSVKSGAPARAQLFHDTLVRVASSGSMAETSDAPDYSAESDSEMPWVGAVLIGAALLIFGARLYAVRRRDA